MIRPQRAELVMVGSSLGLGLLAWSWELERKSMGVIMDFLIDCARGLLGRGQIVGRFEEGVQKASRPSIACGRSSTYYRGAQGC